MMRRAPIDATFLVVVLLDGAAIGSVRVRLPAHAVGPADAPVAVSLQSVLSFVRGTQRAPSAGGGSPVEPASGPRDG